MTSMGQFRGDAEFSTWLYRLVVNVCMDAARRQKSDAVSSDRSQLEMVPGAASQGDDYARAQMASSVRAAVSALPPKFRIAVLLRYFEDLSYEQMARSAALFHGDGGIQAEPGASDVSRAPQGMEQAGVMFEPDRAEFGSKMLEHLPKVEAPDAIWQSIEADLERIEFRSVPAFRPSGDGLSRLSAVLAVLFVIAVVGGLRSGANGSKPMLTLASRSRWASIGSVEVEPGTRLRVVTEARRGTGLRSLMAKSMPTSPRRPSCSSWKRRRARPSI